MDFDVVADELYGLAPAEFTRVRDARVTEARSAGDRATADALKRLRRPTVGAWLANRLARQRRDELERFLALAAELRAAQERLDGETLRRLSREGREAVVAFVREAPRDVGPNGPTVSDGSLQELERTLDAALADPDAAQAVRAGRLSTGLQYSGLGLGGVTADEPARGSRPAPPAAARELERAQSALERAKDQLRDAQAAVAAAEATLAERRNVAERALDRVRDAEKAVRSAAKLAAAPSHKGS